MPQSTRYGWETPSLAQRGIVGHREDADTLGSQHVGNKNTKPGNKDTADVRLSVEDVGPKGVVVADVCKEGLQDVGVLQDTGRR